MSETRKFDPFDPPLTIQVGQIQFIEACHPPLVAGAYAVRMSQTIKETKETAVPWNSDPYALTLQFSVAAPRFTLNPADIHSVYPPSNQTGRFDNALPHVVFTRRTLPWERTLHGTAPELGKPFPPWMGLLLLQEEELLVRDHTGQPTDRRYEVKPLPVMSQNDDSLLFPKPAAGTNVSLLVPDVGQHGVGTSSDKEQKFRAEQWAKEKEQYDKEQCLVIDLPAALFKALAPRLDELSYLAHVRQIDTGDKEVQAHNDKGWFSLIVGNRMPQANHAHRVFLVSFEGHQERLQESWQPQANHMIRLAVLGTWGFTCEGENDFKSHMQRLRVDSLCLPHEGYKDESLEAKDIVNAAYARGYTAFNHVMRQGEKTVSWYRGPLVPLDYAKPTQVQEPVSCADELLRYDPDTGLFDVTYAAAWQLGRLLALQNHSFALALNRVRKALRAEAERQMRVAELKALNNGKTFIEDDMMEQLANGGGQKLIEAIPK